MRGKAMFNWTKEKAIVELEALIKEIPDLMKRNRFCAEHTRWVSNTLRILEQVFGRKSRYYLSFANRNGKDRTSHCQRWEIPIY